MANSSKVIYAKLYAFFLDHPVVIIVYKLYFVVVAELKSEYYLQ